jgi:hypothetical protein
MNDSESNSIIGKSLNQDLLSTVEKIGKIQGYDGGSEQEKEQTPTIEEVTIVNPTQNEVKPAMNAATPRKKSSSSVKRLESIKQNEEPLKKQESITSAASRKNELIPIKPIISTMQKTIPLKPRKDAEAQTSATAEHQTHRTIEIQTQGGGFPDYSQRDDINNLEINTVLQATTSA